MFIFGLKCVYFFGIFLYLSNNLHLVLNFLFMTSPPVELIAAPHVVTQHGTTHQTLSIRNCLSNVKNPQKPMMRKWEVWWHSPSGRKAITRRNERGMGGNGLGAKKKKKKKLSRFILSDCDTNSPPGGEIVIYVHTQRVKMYHLTHWVNRWTQS